jgi:uncharacterized membrane protein YdjX (TVP38/TMEM64 family)
MDGSRRFLIAMAACCMVPMAFVVVLTSVLGVALGWASALALGLVAAGVCVAVMAQRHREEHRDRAAG